MEQIRRCRICGKDKSVSEFYPTYAKGGGGRRVCKRCFLRQNREYHEKHRGERLVYLKEYHQAHRERAREANRTRQRQRLATDPVYKAKRHAQLSIWRAFNKQGQISPEKIRYWVGCSADELTEHLKRTWKNEYGTEWNGQPYNVDHIIPLLTAKTIEDIKVLCHYTNLRLITPRDNFVKGLGERRGNSINLKGE